MDYVVMSNFTKTGRINGYNVVDIESGKVIASFRISHYADWRDAKAAAQASWARLCNF